MTFEALKLDLRVTDDMWSGLFDHMEIWRSRQGIGGPYEELTGTSWSPAKVAFLAKPYVVNGRKLSLLVMERVPVDIVFSGSDPLSASSIAAQINTQGLGLLSASIIDGVVVLSTIAPGTLASLRILSSDAAGIFSLPTQDPSNIFFGQDARFILTLGTTLYPFVDPFGEHSFFYKLRFDNASNFTVSEFSDAFQVSGGVTLPESDLILGSVDLFDLDGSARSNVRVQVYANYNGALLNGKSIVGTTLEQLTDIDGHAAFQLVRGSKVTVAVAGTPLARTITVPTDPTQSSFNLLDPSIADPDVFTVQVPDYEYATRRSL